MWSKSDGENWGGGVGGGVGNMKDIEFNFKVDFMSPAILNITKTSLYNLDPLKPYFYIVKLGFTGVYIIFLLLKT